jgi:hypothetical protein
MNKFNYVIARKSEGGKGELSPYHFHKTVIFYGDLEDAQKTLRCIKTMDERFADKYQIHKLIEETIK